MNLIVTMLSRFLFKKIVFLLLFSLLLSHIQAQVVYVDAGSACISGCGGSWATAYFDLEEAINATNSGQIWVAKGTYRPADCPGSCQNVDRLKAFQLKSNVEIYGGFFGNETAIDQRNPVVNETFLSGNIGFDINQTDNSFHVVVATNVDSTALLDGFIIRDGLANGTFGTNNGSGGALYIEAFNMETSSPVIRNCVFTVNEASAGGGAIFVNVAAGSTANPVIEDCIFKDNATLGTSSGGAILHTVTEGGALSPIYRRCTFENNNSGDNGGVLAFFSSNLGTVSAPKIEECSFLNNEATGNGAAVYMDATDNAVHKGAIQNCTFSHNESVGSGGAIFDHSGFGAVSTTRILNCQFEDNVSSEHGGAVYIRGSQDATNFTLVFNCIFDHNGTLGSGGAIYTTSAFGNTDLGVCRPKIINCTFFNNVADDGGEALFNHFSNTELSNSILWDRTSEIGNNNSNPTIRDCIIKGGYNDLGSFSNIYEADPLFLKPEEHNFHLSFCSPGIDVGQLEDIPIDSSDVDADASNTEQIDIDADGIGRTFGTTVDLGAFEWNGSPGEDDVIFVKWDASGNNDGSSWENAFTDLQSALSATYPCADIWVAAGEYKPVSCAGICTAEEQGTSFNMKNHVAIYGGFRGVESLLEERDIAGNETILNGNIGDLNTGDDNAFHVVYADNIDSTGILDGFTIMEGNATGGFGGNGIYGGGLYIEASTGRANPSIRNCTFRANKSKGGGGALYLDATEGGVLYPVFENCSFLNNSITQAANGGAVGHNGSAGAQLSPVYRNCTFTGNNTLASGGALSFVIDGENSISRPQFQECHFQGNSATQRGGAIYANASANADHQMVIQNTTFLSNNAGTSGGAVFEGATLGSINTSRIINVVFRQNRAALNGAAIFINGSDSGTNRSIIFNSLFELNSSEQNGGAIFNSAVLDGLATGNCEPSIINCTFSGNVALSGLAIYNDQANPEINNSILWNGGNEITDFQAAPIVQNCVIQGGYQGDGFVSDIIDEDPLFLNVAGADFRLPACSPAIDEGLTGLIPFDFSDVDEDNDSGEQIDIDLLESLRLFGARVDLGAFEWNGFPAALTIEVQKDDVNCFGFCDGTVSIDPEGGTGNYLVAWSDGQEVFETNELCPGDYRITVSDGSHCTIVDSVEITENEELEIMVTPDTTVCEETVAPLTAIGVGGAGGYTYLWSNNLGESSTVSFSGEEDQQIIVIVTDDNGCLKIDSIDIAIAENPIPAIIGPSAFCLGDSILLETNEFEQYSWSSGQVTPAINVSEGGNYELTVTDVNGCIGIAMTDIAELAAPEPMIEGDTAFCIGSAAQLEVGLFETYEWSTGDTTATTSAFAEGNYMVTVTDVNGCEGEDTFAVSMNEGSEVSIDGEVQFCSGDSITLDAGLFESYEWSTGAITATINVSQADAYSVTVVDEGGCIAADTIEVAENMMPIVEIEGVSGFCPGDSTQLEVGPFSAYLWSTGEMTPVIQVMVSNEYSITVTDENGCMAETQIQVEAFEEPMVEIIGELVFCEGDSTILEAGDFQEYSWTGGATTPTLVVLDAGNYGLTVLDDNGCQAETAVEIIENTNPTVEISGDESYCVGDSTALDAGLFVSYLWSTTEETQSIDASQPGTYEVEVVDDNGCTGSGSIEISELALPEPQIEGLLSFCDGGSTTLSTGTFEGYEWSTGGMTAEVSVMQTGTFSVTVEDTNGCFGTSSVEVMEAEDIQFEITGELTFCDGDSTQLNAGDFETYEWSTGDMTSTIMANSSGTYDVTVTNSGGCTGESSIVVQENDPLNVNIAGQANFCEGTTTSLTVDIGFDTYIWSNDATGNNIEVEEGGTYMVTVTDDTGCSGMASLEVSETPAPLPVISGELSICEGEPTSLNVGDFETYLWSDGTNAATLETSTAGLFSVTVTDQNGCTGETAATVEAASQPQAEILGASNGICIGESIELMAFGEGAYTWIDTDGTLTVISSDLAVASPANAVTYGLIVSNNCFSDTTFLELQIFDSPLIDAGSDVIVKVGEEVRLEASGASAYEWSGGNFLSCTACVGPIATPDSTTTFIATGIDANGCQGIDSVRVTVLSEDVKLVDAVNAFTPNNDGVNDFFAIKEIEQFSDHKLTIFNRWGDTVYESLDYQNDWDGTYNGELLPAGTYLYVLVINALGEKQVIKSTITIVRE